MGQSAQAATGSPPCSDTRSCGGGEYETTLGPGSADPKPSEIVTTPSAADTASMMRLLLEYRTYQLWRSRAPGATGPLKVILSRSGGIEYVANTGSTALGSGKKVRLGELAQPPVGERDASADPEALALDERPIGSIQRRDRRGRG